MARRAVSSAAVPLLTAAPTSAAGLRSLRAAAPLAVVAVAGIALRVWVYRGSMGVPSSDEAIVALMAEHLLHGQFTVFFWNQGYGGSQEALLTAPVFWIAGPSWAALRAVPIAITAVAALVLWRVAVRLYGEPGGRTAAALLWIWPPFLVFESTHQLGFYASDVLYCVLILLLALRLVERPDVRRAVELGLVLGLAFWQTAQIVPVAVPVLLWTVWREPATLRRAPRALAAFVLGALPWIVWNLTHGFGSLTFEHKFVGTYAERVRFFVSPLLPMVTGIRVPFDQAPVVGSRRLADVLVLLLLAVLAGAAVVAFRRRRTSDVSLLYVVALVFPFVYAISPMTAEVHDPRYLIVLTPVLVLMVGQAASTSGRALLLLVALGALSVAGLHELDGYFRQPEASAERAPRDLRPLVALLHRLRIDRAYADPWIAYVLDFDTHERIVATQNDMDTATLRDGVVVPGKSFIRRAAYERAVEASRRPGFLLFTDQSRASIVPVLRRYGYRPHRVGNMLVYAPGRIGAGRSAPEAGHIASAS